MDLPTQVGPVRIRIRGFWGSWGEGFDGIVEVVWKRERVRMGET